MILALALTIASTQNPPNPFPVQIAPRGREFVLRAGSKVDRVPVEATVYPPVPKAHWPTERVLFRRDAAYAVWDSRGLSVRQGSWVFTTHLPEIPLTPKLFSREEILETKKLIDGKVRKADASGVVGAVRDGTRVFFLVKWDEADGQTWLEALVSVDLTEDKPKPKLVGRFEALTLNLNPDKSRLFIRDRQIATWVRSDESWGLARYDPQSDAFGYEVVGERPEAVELVDDRIGWFIGRTEFGSKIFYRWDLKSLNRRELAETRGTIRLMSARTPWVAVIHEDEGAFLQNLETGGRNRLPPSPAFRWTAFGVLVWTPAVKPTKAILYDADRWDVIGRWPAGG